MMSRLLPIGDIFELCRFSFSLGLATLFSRHEYSVKYRLKQGFHRLLAPMDYFRYGELTLAKRNLIPITSEDVVLDLSSPKLLSLFLGKTTSAKVYATDLLDYFFNECKLASGVLKISNNYKVELCDGRNLPYENCMFTRAFSISVLEHIPNEGDIETIKELVRILKPGGLLVISVPIKPEYTEVFVPHSVYEREFLDSEPQFWCRYYDEDSIYSRLINPSGLSLVDIKVINEFPNFWDWFSSIKSRTIQRGMMPLWPILAYSFLRIGNDFKEVKNTGIAVLCLRKEYA